MITQSLPFDEEEEADTIKATCYGELKFDSADWKAYSGKSISLLTKMLTKSSKDRATID